MITPDIIARINELARKQRECGLTEHEQTEQSQLRRLYIDHMKEQVKIQLDSTLKAKDDHHHGGCDCHHH